MCESQRFNINAILISVDPILFMNLRHFNIGLSNLRAGEDEKNKIRYKMVQCFDGISAHGLPWLTLPDDVDNVDYPYLNDRYKNSLKVTADTIVEKLQTPRHAILQYSNGSLVSHAYNSHNNVKLSTKQKFT